MDNATVRKHKSALTRAKKVGPGKIINVCNAALEDFEDNGYPDCWHIWQVAKNDAERELAYQNWSIGRY